TTPVYRQKQKTRRTQRRLVGSECIDHRERRRASGIRRRQTTGRRDRPAPRGAYHRSKQADEVRALIFFGPQSRAIEGQPLDPAAEKHQSPFAILRECSYLKGDQLLW